MALLVNIEKTLGKFCLKMNFRADHNVLALLGASGCGKSMTLKCIAGIETPDRGRIELDGRILYDSEKGINLPPQKRRVGYLFQQYALFPNMTVVQNIAAGVRDKAQQKMLVEQAVKAMHLTGLEGKHPNQLSGGQQQRVALARILVNSPDVLLLDEPFSALDSHLRFQLENELRSAIHQFGKTVVLVSHNRDEAFRLSHDIAIMHDGQIETIGEKKAVFANPQTRNGAILTGCKNVLRIEKKDERTAYLPDWHRTLTLNRDIGEARYIGIRMHDIEKGTNDENTVPCEVVEEIENPFSLTVMLHPCGAKPDVRIGWERNKAEWTSCSNVDIQIPKEQILLLRE